LQYLPFGETRVDQRTSYWNSRYSFSGKEKDEESGYSYFGARYYDSDLSIWLSVDPLSDKYPFISPYVYCVNNPIKYWDPDGRWIPGLDENGNTTYTAEKGDNLHTFQKQFGVGKKEALSIFNQSKISTADNDRFAAGQHVIKGDIVKEYTGSDVLKGQWHNLTNTQKAAQIMFGMMYSEYHNQTADNGTYSMNINDFVDGFYVGSSGLNLNNVQIPAKGGGTIQIDQMSISPSSTIGNPPLIYHGAYGGNEQSRTDGSTFASYHFMSARNKNATHSFKVINISVPTGSNNNKFRKSY
jgi:RHS repeat-associated protein